MGLLGTVTWYTSWAVLSFLGLSFAILAGAYYYQDSIIFFPKALPNCPTPDKNPRGFRYPSEYGMRFEDLKIESSDGVVLHTWLIYTKDPRGKPTVMFFQGNAGNIGFRLSNLVEMIVDMDVNVIAPSYRGYGWSSGTPSERGIVDDAQAVLDYFITANNPNVDINKLFLFGRSLGGAVAFRLAHDNPQHIRGVMVENTFYNMRTMASTVFPPLRLIPYLVDRLLRTKFDTGSLIGKMDLPALFIGGTDDTLIPPAQMKQLFDEYKGRMKWKVAVQGGTHNDTWTKARAAYYGAIADFIRSVLNNTDRTAKRIVIADNQYCSTEEESKDFVREPKFYEVILRQLSKFETSKGTTAST